MKRDRRARTIGVTAQMLREELAELTEKSANVLNWSTSGKKTKLSPWGARKQALADERTQ